MHLFYNPDITAHTTQCTFDAIESRHIIKVLRKVKGDKVFLTNGKGFLFHAELEHSSSKKCLVKIISKTKQNKRPYTLDMAVAPTKSNDRYEWFLEKATEIGVDSITPIICDRSERKIIKPERYKKILQTAMKQSLSCFLPELRPAVSFESFMTQKIEGARLIAHCENLDKKSLKMVLEPTRTTTILIGPEGDFSVKEINIALQNNFTPISLGNSRLRTETAAIAACHSVAFINQ